jgi:hypothetical protein
MKLFEGSYPKRARFGGHRLPNVLGRNQQMMDVIIHEKACYHWWNAHWQHDALRGPFLFARVARGGRFGGAGQGGSPGRAASDARQRRGCGAQKYAARGTTLRRRRYLLSRVA